MTSPVQKSVEFEGALVRLVLDRPKANIVDVAMVEAIREELRWLADQPGVKLLVFEGAGRHFSFGASVEEHLPGKVDQMLPAFHAMFRELEALAIPTAAVVRGQCLGGGMELALYCGTVFCDRTTQLGVPEIKLGVFPPVAALMLPWRANGALATRMITTGQSIDGETAMRYGLVDDCCDDPEAELKSWFEAQLKPKSALSLRYAWRAARRPIAAAVRDELPALEKLYLTDLMSHHDPAEGITAFVERRAPLWRHQ